MPRLKEIHEDFIKRVINAHRLEKVAKTISKEFGLHHFMIYKCRELSTMVTLLSSGHPAKITTKGVVNNITEVTKTSVVTSNDLKTLALINVNVHHQANTEQAWCA